MNEFDLIKFDDIDSIEANAVRNATADANETSEREENLFLRRFSNENQFSIENFHL